MREAARSAGGRDGRGRAPTPTHGLPAAKYFPTSGPWPPPTFAAARQRRDLIIAYPLPVGVSKEGGPQPSLFGRFKGIGFLRKGGNRNPPFLKWRSLVTFFRQGKKVTRRRQKGKGQKKEKSCTGGQRRPPLHTSTENPCAIYPGGCGHPPLRNHRQARASSIRRDEVIAPYEKGRR